MYEFGFGEQRSCGFAGRTGSKCGDDEEGMRAETVIGNCGEIS